MRSRTPLGDRLRIWLRHRGRRQRWLANELGIADSTVCDWIAGRYSPRQDLLEQACDALDVSLSEFWGALPTERRRAS